MITSLSPITVEKLDTELKRPVVLRLEKKDPHITEILDVFLEIPVVTSVKVGL